MTVIDLRIQEHSKIIEQVDDEVKSLNKSGMSSNIERMEAQRRLILKDKILFHRAAILALKDLKEEING